MLLHLSVHAGERKMGVDHAEHALAGLVDVAGGARTIGRVVDGPHHAQHGLAVFGEFAGAASAGGFFERRRSGMALHTALGALVDDMADFARVGGKGDASVLIEEVDAPDSRLAAQILDDIEEGVAVIVQHLVTRAAQDDVGDALGGLLHHIPRIGALHPQVEEAE